MLAPHFRVGTNLHAALGELAAGVAAELFAKLRKNIITGMNQNDAEHLGFEVRIIGESPFQKIVYTAGCFNAGKSGPGNDECQERQTILLGTVSARLLEPSWVDTNWSTELGRDSAARV
jgi:hypothetical protein